MNYLRRFFVTLVLFSFVVYYARGFHLFSRAAIVLGAAFLAAVLLRKFALSPWKDLKDSLLRIKNGEYEARLDDVSGGDVSECAAAFNELAEELARYRKLSEDREKRLTALTDSVGSGLLLFDPDSAVIFANGNVGLMFPYFRKEAPIASLDIPYLLPFIEEARSCRERRRKSFKEGEKGRGRVFDVTFVPLEEKNWAMIMDDVTAESRMEQVKSDLVANVSHELRTPISAISSICDVLEDPSLEPEKKAEFISRLKKQARRMSLLVDDLLSLSHLEGGEVVPGKENVRLWDLVSEISASLEPMTRSLGTPVEIEMEKDLSVNTDPRLLEQAVKNILDNAIRYNKPGGKVSVTAGKLGDVARIEIKDTGEGIPAQFSDRIFERFFRVDPHRSREKGGTGLGLSIAKHSVKLLGGDIQLESSVGKGSTFIITIPE